MKIVINGNFGGFGYDVADAYKDFVNQLAGERDDLELVAFVENHPDERGDLCVVEIPDNATDWEIDEYDGSESVTYVVNGKIYHGY